MPQRERVLSEILAARCGMCRTQGRFSARSGELVVESGKLLRPSEFQVAGTVQTGLRFHLERDTVQARDPNADR